MNIKIENVTKQFKENKALDGVSLDIGEGIFGLLGENGAGKTTLMRILTTLIEPTDGNVTICGQKLCASNREEIKRLIGYLPQELGLYPSLTVRETLDYIGGLCGLNHAERKARIDSLLEQTNMHIHQNKKNKQLSGGMKRRVGLMQAMLTNPKVLIVDEPTTGLDPEERIRIRNLLVDFSKDRIVIFSTHVIEDLSATCLKLGVLKKGKVKYQGEIVDMMKAAEGHVFQTLVRNEMEMEDLKSRYSIVNSVFGEDGYKVKFISKSYPNISGISNAEISLEDAYIFLNSMSD
ncbi:MAG: ABC transporter ATP-binding protein [Ruminococcus sp.]|uniref:ABC transporter ATP-binding protein n=1 Tax=Ruminococcus sp. TaxID=41978 RepID=UPI0025E4202E|nr:ABC transporter ATP-binding protein [Ruminococcus sp.]MCR5541246.1 ABC transporter ATP-binding protein [Ruminococcus sp.]